MINFFARGLTVRETLAAFSSAKTEGHIDLHEFDSFTKVVLNRPASLNTLSLRMIRLLRNQIPNFNKAKAVWFQGVGDKAFCAGGDVKHMFLNNATVEDRLTFIREQFSNDYFLAQLKSQQIAVWDGYVMGGGYGISCMAPFRIATENTIFAMPQAKLGFFTDVCSCYSLARLRNNIGLYLGMTGSKLKGEDTYISGIANYYIQRKHLEAIFDQLKSVLPSSTDSKKTVAKVLDKYHEPSGRTALPHEKEIKELFSIKDFREIYKKVSGQTDEFSINMTRDFNDLCPPYVGIIHRLIETAKEMSYRECYLRDFKLAQHCIVDPNFAEGVRTVLIEKRGKANWSHKSILDVTDEEVERYFTFPPSFENLNI